MRRRELIVALTGLTLCPARTYAQQPSRKIPRIGWLVPSPRAEQDNLQILLRCMSPLLARNGHICCSLRMSAVRGIVLQNSKIPPRQKPRESELIASFG
jgi:hypothetical protein